MAAAPPAKSVIYAALGLPPGGDPLDFPDTPQGACDGGNVGFRSLYVGDPVSGNGMAAMTNGDKGEEVCNGLRRSVATGYGWR